MKVSVITAVFNGAKTIQDCIKSVSGQIYPNIEHIIIDGGSTDGTLEVIKRYTEKRVNIVSEPDNGIYDALNKGIRQASGEVIGLLYSDDFYAHDRVIEKVADIFMKYNIDSCYGDLQYVDKNNPDKVIRYWKSSQYRHGKFKYGWMPPHSTFFVKKEIYNKYGYFNTNFKIAADYELMLRFLEKHKISTYYTPEVFIKMRIGGTSNRNIKNLIIKSNEDYRAWKVNNLNGGFYTILLKNLCKIPQFFKGT
ncbi:MAG: glycosyl transferase [Candidatus Aenigmarchaeota archaeon CG1_02_38_14]|nr:MAG: glycosyl transferase [Candidatus Aenigmarchaeota archaeon CG1_02_38_14]